jgi:hypothetical protein
MWPKILQHLKQLFRKCKSLTLGTACKPKITEHGLYFITQLRHDALTAVHLGIPHHSDYRTIISMKVAAGAAKLNEGGR